MIRIALMYYLNILTSFNKPDEDFRLMFMEVFEPSEAVAPIKGDFKNKRTPNLSISASWEWMLVFGEQ